MASLARKVLGHYLSMEEEEEEMEKQVQDLLKTSSFRYINTALYTIQKTITKKYIFPLVIMKTQTTSKKTKNKNIRFPFANGDINKPYFFIFHYPKTVFQMKYNTFSQRQQNTIKNDAHFEYREPYVIQRYFKLCLHRIFYSFFTSKR